MEWLRSLGTVLVRPRQTLRRILDRGRDPMVIPLVLLTIISAFLADFDRAEFEKARQQITGVPVILMIVGGLIAGILIMLGLFYLFSWVVTGIGKLLEGRAKAREVRSALAWGFAPIIWALLYRIPAAIFGSPGESSARQIRIGDELITIPEGGCFQGCAEALPLMILELVVFVWYIIVASLTVGEAHQFSGWRGFATLAICLGSPLILVVAAILASHT